MPKKKPEKAGGPAGETFRTQLAVLVQRAGSQAAFARMCNVSVQTLSDWTNGVSCPGFEQLVHVAERSRVPLDWLIVGRGPETFESTRERGSLEADLGAAIAQELLRRVPPDIPGATEPYTWLVSGEGIMRLAMEAITPDAVRAVEIMRDRVKLENELRIVLDYANEVNARVAKRQKRSHGPLSETDKRELDRSHLMLRVAGTIIEQLKRAGRVPAAVLLPQQMADEFWADLDRKKQLLRDAHTDGAPQGI